MALPTSGPQASNAMSEHVCSCKACCVESGSFAGFTHALDLIHEYPTGLKFCGMLIFVLLQVFSLVGTEVKLLMLASVDHKHLSQALPCMRQQPAPWGLTASHRQTT